MYSMPVAGSAARARPPGDRFGGGREEDWNGEARSKQNGRRKEGVTGSPTATVAVAACSTSAPLSGGGAAAARWHRLLETTATAPGFSFVILWCSRRKGGRESSGQNAGSLFSKVRTTPLHTILFFSIESCRLYTCRRRRQRGLGWLGGRAPPHFCPKTTLVMPTWFDDGRTDRRTADLSLIPLPLVAPSFPHTAIPRPTCCAAATAVFFPSCLQPAGEAGCNLTQPGDQDDVSLFQQGEARSCLGKCIASTCFAKLFQKKL